MLDRSVTTNVRGIAWMSILLTFLTSGASCPRGFRRPAPAAPLAFIAPPSLDQVQEFLRVQSSRVESLQTTGARLQVPGAPALSASLALERPKKLRMQASLGFTGPEIDLGSNEEEFWFWARRNDLPGVYFARHSDASSPKVRAMLPVPPTWLIEALGLVELDSTSSWQGPLQRSADTFEIRTDVGGPDGPLTKVLILDTRYGFVREQSVFDSAGRLLATASASQHQYLPGVGVSLPREIKVQLPTMPLEFELHVDGYVVNQPTTATPHLWQRPEFPGSPAVNLAYTWGP